MLSSLHRFQMPLWRYLNQPLFETQYTPILNPRRFWYVYQVEYLERCLAHPVQSSGQIDV